MIKVHSFLLFNILFIAFSVYAMEQVPTITTTVQQQAQTESKSRPQLILKGITTGILSFILAKYTYLMYQDTQNSLKKSKDLAITVKDQDERERAKVWFDRFIGITLVELYVTYRLSKECIKSWYDLLTLHKQPLTENNKPLS